MSTTCGMSSTWTPFAAPASARRRPARRRRAALLGADQQDLRAGHRRRQPAVDPTFSFMTVDHDGAIRMDCSSPYAMARLVGLKDRYRVAFANDPDADRHGIVTPGAGLMNPNHYLAVAIDYLLTHRPRLAGRGRGRQDPGQQQHDRPGRAEAGPPPVRGAGRLQVVRAGPVRRLVLLWRRGERRGQLPAARRQAFGRPTRTGRSWICWPPRSPPAPARIRESTIDALTAEFGTAYYTASMRRRRRSRRRGSEDCRQRRSRRPTWPANRSSQS